MTNIAYKDRAGGRVNVWSKDQHKPKWERIKAALEDLKHMGNIKIFIYKGRKLRLIKTKSF